MGLYLPSPSRRSAKERAYLRSPFCTDARCVLQSDAPGYYDIVKRPMDLKTIKEKIKDGSIANLDDMHSAMLTMFA